MPGKPIKLSSLETADFLAQNYPKAYNEIQDVKDLPMTTEGATIMNFPIPQTIGKIAKVVQKSGHVFYYIRKFPLYYNSNGQLVYYKGQGFTSKAKALQARRALIRRRNAGHFKFDAVQVENEVKKAQTQKINPEIEVSYYDFCRQFIEKRPLAAKTRKDYLSLIEHRFQEHFANVPVAKLTKGILQNFIDQYTQNMPKTFIILRMTLERLYALELIPHNFYLQLIRSKEKNHRPQKQALNKDELKRFLGYFKGNRLEHAMYLIFYTGLREGELLALQWNDIEFINKDTGCVHVKASWGLTEIGYGRKEPKTPGSVRVVPFKSAYLVTVLKEAKVRSNSKWVVENNKGNGPMDPKNFTNRCFKDVSRKLGFTTVITSHVARHTYISHLVDERVPYTLIAKLAGHTTTEMVARVYAHPINDTEKELAAVANLYND
jgi:integrase